MSTTCHQCQLLKEHSTPLRPPTLKIATHYPFELVAADLISLPHTPDGYVGCLVVVDPYSKGLAVVPIKNKKSSTVVTALTVQVFSFLPSVPATILTDNGPEFVSAEFSNFPSQSNVKYQLTTPYCPSSNGAVERVNHTIIGFLHSLVTDGCGWNENLFHAVTWKMRSAQRRKCD